MEPVNTSGAQVLSRNSNSSTSEPVYNRGETPSIQHIDEAAYQAEPESSIQHKVEEEAAVREPNFKLEIPYSAEVAASDKNTPAISLPSGTEENIRKSLRNSPNIKSGLDEVTAKYINVINSSLSTLPFAGGLVGTADRQSANYAQQVPTATIPILGYAPKFKKKEGVKYTGESARNLIRSAMKLGTVFSVPLWHSGFWITLRSPSDGDLLELYRKITQEKITLGRSTYGLMYSNVSAYTSKALLDFIVDNIYETSLALDDNQDIRNYIQLPDLSLLIWGLACATWPNGFQFNRACITDVDKCKHVISEKLNLSKLLWTDTSSLTERQIQHMTNRQRGSMSVESVKIFMNDFIRGKERKIDINEDLSFILTMPTAAEHIDAGYRWISHIEEEYGRAMEQNEATRNDYLLSHAQATGMRQYRHCVKSVIAMGDEIDGLEDVDNALNDLTARDDIRDEFMSSIAEFLDESIISFIAIPTYKCPACGGMQKPATEGKYPELIPLDVTQTFFPLLIQKLQNIRER